MKIFYYLTRPFGLAILTVLMIGAAVLISRAQKPPKGTTVLAVLQAQQATAQRCTPNEYLLLIPYAKWIAEIDASACPNDFVKAWEKYVSDVRTLAVARRQDTGRARLFGGIAVLSENPALVPRAVPSHTGASEISLNATVADWQNITHVASRYGVKAATLEFSKLPPSA